MNTMFHRAKFPVCFGALAALGLAMITGTAMAQSQRPMPSPGGATAPAPTHPADKVSSSTVEGTVKKVEPGAGNLEVSSGPLGILGKKLEVTDSTQILVEGRQATLADVREGAKVKASYENRDGKNVATQINVMREADRETTKPPKSQYPKTQ